MSESGLPWSTLFGLLFTTMGPIRAIAVFGGFGENDTAPGVRALATRAVGLVAIAFVVAVFFGERSLAGSGVGLPALIAAAGLILVALSLQSMIVTPPWASHGLDATQIRAAQVAFPGLFPPIAVSIPIIFAAAQPGFSDKLVICGLGAIVLALNWLAMRHSKSILHALGPTPLQLAGAVFGVLQVALGVEFLIDAYRMYL